MSKAPVGRTVDRFLEVLAVILLGIATVGTAWCGLQSSLWSGESDRIANVAAEERADANRLFGLASTEMSYDATIVASYAQAVASGNHDPQQFYRTTLVRKGFLRYLDAWEAQIKAGQTPQNLLDDKAYTDEMLGPYRAAQAQADLDAKAGENAGRWGGPVRAVHGPAGRVAVLRRRDRVVPGSEPADGLDGRVHGDHRDLSGAPGRPSGGTLDLGARDVALTSGCEHGVPGATASSRD